MDANQDGAAAFVNEAIFGNSEDTPWETPDLSVMRLGRRAPPKLPVEVFGPVWGEWIANTAEAAASPVDYVATNLLAAASALIGHARWVQATPGWREPPHLWACNVGDSGTGKSGGADALGRDVLPEIENRMIGDFPDRHAEWTARQAEAEAQMASWKEEVRRAAKSGNAPPMPPARFTEAEPQAPRLRQSDVTIEKCGTLLAHAAPKGLLVSRDEIAGWLLGLTSYNDAGRAFWIEAYGGRPFRIERVKIAEPVIIPRLAVSVAGSIQPERLSELFREADDGLLARLLWAWPEPTEFHLSRKVPGVEWAIEGLDRLRALDLRPGEDPGKPPRPVYVPLVEAALPALEIFGQEMQRRQQEAGGLARSAYGKARGVAIRLALVLEYLRWCGEPGFTPPPDQVSETAFLDACDLTADYFLPMAERVYGDAAATREQRDAATLARWIWKHKPEVVHVRRLQREVRLPGLTTAAAIHAAAAELIDAAWLKAPIRPATPGRPLQGYRVNPAIHGGQA